MGGEEAPCGVLRSSSSSTLVNSEEVVRGEGSGVKMF